MFLVSIHWFCNNSCTPCVVAETEEKAQEYINKQMERKNPSGMGTYKIRSIEAYQ